jgi:putative transposase
VCPPSEASQPPSYRGYRYPVEISSHAVWLYFRFHLSLRDVEELLAERGVTVTYETIRAWCAKFGPSYAAGLRRRRAQPSDKWHLDEVQLKIKGKRYWLWRAVDKHGTVLDVLVQQRLCGSSCQRPTRPLCVGMTERDARRTHRGNPDQLASVCAGELVGYEAVCEDG